MIVYFRALIQIIVSDDQNVDLSGEIILPNSNVGQVDVDLEQTQNALMIVSFFQRRIL